MANIEKLNRVTVEIAGQQLTLLTNNEPEYIQALAKYVSQRMEKIQINNPRLSTCQAALLAAVNLADEVFSVKGKNSEETRGDDQ